VVWEQNGSRRPLSFTQAYANAFHAGCAQGRGQPLHALVTVRTSQTSVQGNRVRFTMISRLSGDCSHFAPTRRPSDAYRGEPAGRASLATEDKLTTPRGRQPPKGRLERRWHVDGPAGAPPLSGRVIERDDVVLPPHLQVRHGLSKELLQHMAAVESLAAAVAE
jgi:hypothetical protein